MMKMKKILTRTAVALCSLTAVTLLKVTNVQAIVPADKIPELQRIEQKLKSGIASVAHKPKEQLLRQIITEEEVYAILQETYNENDDKPALDVFKVESNQDLMIGSDYHGDAEALVDNIDEVLNDPNKLYINLGDNVDRGLLSIETEILLQVECLLHPDKFHRILGNHEFQCSQNCRERSGLFYQENILKYPSHACVKVADKPLESPINLFEDFREVLKFIPCMAVAQINGQGTLFVHGGIGSDSSLDQMQKLKLPIASSSWSAVNNPSENSKLQIPFLTHLLMNDPSIDSDFGLNPRASDAPLLSGNRVQLFGKHNLDNFLGTGLARKLNIRRLIRGHYHVGKVTGYLENFVTDEGNSCYTITSSAKPYLYDCDNLIQATVGILHGSNNQLEYKNNLAHVTASERAEYQQIKTLMAQMILVSEDIRDIYLYNYNPNLVVLLSSGCNAHNLALNDPKLENTLKDRQQLLSELKKQLLEMDVVVDDLSDLYSKSIALPIKEPDIKIAPLEKAHVFGPVVVESKIVKSPINFDLQAIKGQPVATASGLVLATPKKPEPVVVKPTPTVKKVTGHPIIVKIVIKNQVKGIIELAIPNRNYVYDSLVKQALVEKHPEFSKRFFNITNGGNPDEFIATFPNTKRNIELLDNFKF